MELEGVGTVSMGSVTLKILGEIDDGNGLEGTLFHAYTATNAERLADESEFALGSNFNTELAELNDWA